MQKNTGTDRITTVMKKDIHPKVNTTAQVKCACGNTFTTISTEEIINVEICSACHPFFTGQQKYVDTEGRIEKFNKKMAVAKNAPKKKSKKDKKSKSADAKPLTLKDMLKEQIKAPTQNKQESQ